MDQEAQQQLPAAAVAVPVSSLVATMQREPTVVVVPLTARPFTGRHLVPRELLDLEAAQSLAAMCPLREAPHFPHSPGECYVKIK